MKLAKPRSRRAVAGIFATVIMFAILFTVGTTYFVFVNSENSSYLQSLRTAENSLQGSAQEGLTVTTLLETDGDIGFYVNNTSSLTVNMTAVVVISSTGSLLQCDGVGFPAGSGCSNTTPALWAVINAGQGSATFDTGYVYVAGTTDTVKAITARGNTFSSQYPENAQQTGSAQSVAVSLDNLKWVQLLPQSSSLVQKKFVSNCNAAACAASYSSSVTAANVLVDAVSWPSTNPPASAPSDTLHDSFTLGASASVTVPSAPAVVQNKYTSNCNAASCGLAFTSSVTAGHMLVYALGWSNQNAPSTPTDTLGDSFALGSSQSETVVPPTPALVQDRYTSNCNSATCALAYTSSVTAGNTLIYGLGWFGTPAYVPITINNCQTPTSLAVDGSNTGSFSSTSSGAVSLTTSKSNDIVVVVASNEDKTNAVTRTVSSVAATGLSFSKRSAVQLSSVYLDTEVWYAVASSALSAVSITVTLSGSTDDASLVAFGVSGANTSTPWDPNGAIPATTTSTSAGAPSVGGVSTTNNNVMLLGFEGAYSSSQSTAETAAAGYTLIQTQSNTGGSYSSQASADEEIVTNVQSSATVAFGTSNSNWTMTGDAIQEGTGCGATGLSIDSSNSARCTGSNHCSVTLSTYKNNDLIYLVIGDNTGGRSVSSVTDAAGSDWNPRASVTGTSSDVFSYFAPSPLTLYSDTITATLSGSSTMSLFAYAIAGANLGSPFDPNLTTAQTNTGSSSTASTTFTTTNANDIIIGATDTSAETVSSGASGYTASLCCSTNSAAFEYKIVSATGSQTPSFSLSGNGAWAAIGDAIQAATSSSTPTTFQQMITWDPATYASYEASNLGNVRFCTSASCGTLLYAWLESCSSSCSPSSTSATAWVKLTSAISQGSSTTIYMVFQSTSTNFDGNYWGEAPNLSSTYAQYDNGASVFNSYFDGNTATTSFSVLSGYTLAQSTGIAYGTGTVNVLKITGYGSNDALVFNTQMSNAGTIAESNFENIDTPTDTGAVALVDNAAAASVQNGEGTNTGYGSAYFNQDWTSGGATTVDQNAQGTDSATWLYASVSYFGSGASVYYSYVSPTLYQPGSGDDAYATVNPLTSVSHIYIGFISSTLSSDQADEYYNWARARAYPPNGAMPWNVFGSFSASTGFPSTPTDTLGNSYTLGASNSIFEATTDYYSYLWYASTATSGADTITATFASAVTGSVSIYEITGYSLTSVQSSTGSSTGGSTAPAVTSFTPASNSFVIGNAESASSASTFTAGSGFTLSGSCSSVYGCGEYYKGLGSATTVPFSLGASTPWVESAISFPVTPTYSYYSYIWYATASGSGSDTISASFAQSVAGSVSIFELSGVTATGLVTGTGGSTSNQGSASVSTITPAAANSVVIGNTETLGTTFTAGSGYTLSGSCSTVGGCGEYETGVSSATTVPMTFSSSGPWAEAAVSFQPITTKYYSYIWYATASTSGADTITTTFGSTTQASVTIYEITEYTTTGALSSTGSSSSGSTTSAVSSFTPASDSFIVGTAEDALATNTYSATSGFTLGGTCSSVEGCSEYSAGGGGSSTTVPLTLSSSSGWVEAAMAFSTPFNPQSGIQVGGYPTMGVPSGANVAWEVTFTNVDPNHRAITIWPQTELAIGSAEYDGFDTDYTQAHYFIVSSLNAGSTTVTAYPSTPTSFITLAYDVPTTLYFASTVALGSATQAFGTNVLTPFEAYFALTGVYSDGTLFGETIPYPYGIITEANAYTTPTAGTTGTTVTVSCSSPCDFQDSSKAEVGWINSEGQFTQLTTFTTSASGNIPAGVTFQVPTAAAGYYTIEVTDYINSVFMTFQHT